MESTLRQDGGKFVVIDPREGKGVVGKYDAKDVLKAVDHRDAINREISAAAAAGTGPRIEILSLTGDPINGIATTKATSAVVYVQRPSKTNKLTADKETTEIDLCQFTGYVLVSRKHDGTVRSDWSGADFPKDVKMTPAGIAALARVLTPAVSAAAPVGEVKPGT